MTFTKHVGELLEKFAVDPLISETDPCFKVNGTTGPPLEFS
jgi:hypothetical protein